MKVLTDLHHRDLFYSNHLLFEKRLGFELFRPIGSEWAKEGLWSIHEVCHNDINMGIVTQFLELDKGENLTGNKSFEKDGIWNLHNDFHSFFHKCIPLNLFKETKFDIILPTHWCHYHLWKELRDKYQPQAKMVYHVGNIERTETLEHVIRSVPYPGECKTDVLAHQELNFEIYKHVPVNTKTKKITSVTHGYMFKDEYLKYKQAMPDFEFKYYGINSPDGILNGTQEVANQMKMANIGWTTKVHGGLGHSNMGWMYSGRPVITNMSQHRLYGECALKLFEPNETCIDIESGTTEDVCKKIKEWMVPEKGNERGAAAKRRFHEVINYDSEAESVKKFLSNIL